MAVYVDDMRKPVRLNRFTANWSHMFADTPEELKEIAKELKLKPQWLQFEGTHKEHYDVTDTVRKQAVALGAVETTYRFTAIFMSNKKKAMK